LLERSIRINRSQLRAGSDCHPRPPCLIRPSPFHPASALIMPTFKQARPAGRSIALTIADRLGAHHRRRRWITGRHASHPGVVPEDSRFAAFASMPTGSTRPERRTGCQQPDRLSPIGRRLVPTTCEPGRPVHQPARPSSRLHWNSPS
jgi:hypothetical protein